MPNPKEPVSTSIHLPDEVTVREVEKRLRSAYGQSKLGNKEDPLDELIFIILSGKTQEITYSAMFDALKMRFRTWDDATQAGPSVIEEIIRSGGLARKKSQAISKLLDAIIERIGYADLTFLQEMDDELAYRFLTSLPGVGPKSARCVLSYSLNRGAFAVDVHISRIVRRLAWSNHHRLTGRVQNQLQELVPPDIRMSLHVNMILHGRLVCTPRAPRCQDCLLVDLCPSAFRV